MAELPNRLQVGMTFDQAIPIINNALDEIDNENRTKIISNQQIANLLLGYQKGGFAPAGDYGLKISKINPGTGLPYDVTTATPDQLAFNSAFDQLRVVKSGPISITIPGTGTGGYGAHVTIPHGQSAAPALLGYFNQLDDRELSGYFWVPTPYNSLEDPVFGFQVAIVADDTNIYAYVILQDITQWYNFEFDFRYYALQETLA